MTPKLLSALVFAAYCVSFSKGLRARQSFLSLKMTLDNTCPQLFNKSIDEEMQTLMNDRSICGSNPTDFKSATAEANKSKALLSAIQKGDINGLSCTALNEYKYLNKICSTNKTHTSQTSIENALLHSVLNKPLQFFLDPARDSEYLPPPLFYVLKSIEEKPESIENNIKALVLLLSSGAQVGFKMDPQIQYDGPRTVMELAAQVEQSIETPYGIVALCFGQAPHVYYDQSPMELDLETSESALAKGRERLISLGFDDGSLEKILLDRGIAILRNKKLTKTTMRQAATEALKINLPALCIRPQEDLDNNGGFDQGAALFDIIDETLPTLLLSKMACKLLKILSGHETPQGDGWSNFGYIDAFKYTRGGRSILHLLVEKLIEAETEEEQQVYKSAAVLLLALGVDPHHFDVAHETPLFRLLTHIFPSYNPYEKKKSGGNKKALPQAQTAPPSSTTPVPQGDTTNVADATQQGDAVNQGDVGSSGVSSPETQVQQQNAQAPPPQAVPAAQESPFSGINRIFFSVALMIESAGGTATTKERKSYSILHVANGKAQIDSLLDFADALVSAINPFYPLEKLLLTIGIDKLVAHIRALQLALTQPQEPAQENAPAQEEVPSPGTPDNTTPVLEETTPAGDEEVQKIGTSDPPTETIPQPKTQIPETGHLGGKNEAEERRKQVSSNLKIPHQEWNDDLFGGNAAAEGAR